MGNHARPGYVGAVICNGRLGVCFKTNLKINSQRELQPIHVGASGDRIQSQPTSAAVATSVRLSSKGSHRRHGDGSGASKFETDVLQFFFLFWKDIKANKQCPWCLFGDE